MKHRVRLDLSFETEADARALLDYAKKLSGKAVSINANEISFADYHLCGHDEGKPCGVPERIEVTKGLSPQDIERLGK